MLEPILSRLKNPKKAGDGYVACCPAHDDKTPSLRVTERNGVVLVYCYAGCPTKDVLDAMGLSWADLFADEAATIKPRIPDDQIRWLATKYSFQFTVCYVADADRDAGKPLTPDDIACEHKARDELAQLTRRYGVEEFKRVAEAWQCPTLYRD